MQIERYDGVLVVRLSGDLREEAARSLLADLAPCLDEGTPRVVVSMADVGYVSSSGIGSLVRLYKDIHDRGGSLCIAGCSQRLRDLFELAGVHLLFELAEDETRAIASLRAAAALEAGGTQ